ISRAFPPPEYAFCVVHGRMKPKEKEASMKLFAGGISNILIATTVIEVGVDVPNATVMVIENAERFGLSQLHQLRGRVGRGTEQSYCILMTNDHLNEESMKRISMMVRTNDGFEIAEADLQLRGPGDIEGTVQSGMPFDLKIAELGKDGQILQSARNAAEKLLHNDPLLQNQAHQLFMTKLKAMRKKQADWSRIS
ncbi:MAG: ATP-dependent DNA helicase RecG, partial [Bacteroidia bacterium]|nr:ATP-dependent DNA helicase RecG [Bacteroidia bacterium]